MVNIAGSEVPINLHINGFIANTWIWILIVAVIGTLLIVGTAILLYKKTYRRKIIVVDPTSGYNIVFRTTARVIRLGPEKVELMKTFSGGHYLSAYAKKTLGAYIYVIGSDGYWYNVSLGDWDAKLGLIDIEPTDRDVRTQNKAVADLLRATYGDKHNLEKWLMVGSIFLMMIVFFIGMYITYGKMADATSNLGESIKTSGQTAQVNAEVSEKLTGLVERLGIVQTQGTGMTPANSTG